MRARAGKREQHSTHRETCTHMQVDQSYSVRPGLTPSPFKAVLFREAGVYTSAALFFSFLFSSVFLWSISPCPERVSALLRETHWPTGQGLRHFPVFLSRPLCSLSLHIARHRCFSAGIRPDPPKALSHFLARPPHSFLLPLPRCSRQESSEHQVLSVDHGQVADHDNGRTTM